MTRYVAIDLAQLPAPTAIMPPVFEAIVAARKAQILALIADPAVKADVAAVLALESEPLVKDVEAGSYRELLHYQRENECVQAVLLATSQGTDLDNFVADLGVERMVLVPATASAPAVMESDAGVKSRYQLALEAFSTAGAYGAYEFEARGAHPDVMDVGVYGPESGFVQPGHARLVVLSRWGDGTPSLQCLTAVKQRFWADENTRPLTDYVDIAPAQIVPYSINYHLQIVPGADPTPIVANAIAALTVYAAQMQRVGRLVALSALDGCAHSDRVNVIRAVNLSPQGDVDPGPQGATWCTNIAVTYEIVT